MDKMNKLSILTLHRGYKIFQACSNPPVFDSEISITRRVFVKYTISTIKKRNVDLSK